MKKFIAVFFSLILLITITGCGSDTKKKVEGNLKTYYEMSDGTYSCEDHVYKKRLEITGRIPNAAKDATFVILSNLDEISFEEAWLNLLSSSSKDFFDVKDAVTVDMR